MAPSDSRCAAPAFTFGLCGPRCPDSGRADGSLVFRPPPCPRAAPPTPPRPPARTPPDRGAEGVAYLERGHSRTTVTNQGGFFALRAVPNGEYDLLASLAGFRTTRRENVRLLVGQSFEVDLRLGLASVEETVLVTGQAPLLEVGRTGAAGYVTEDEIANLPISGRDFVRFALLKPTVQVDPGGRISLSGQRAVNSGLTIDGADAQSAFFGFGRGGLAREGGGALVAQESVQEFQVVTGGYSAEAGRSGGGAMNVVTKSGTNDLAGSGVFFLRDDEMAARLPRSPLDAARGVPADAVRYEVDEFRRYNWGASLGGPIRRDRTHFFLSYDQTAQNQPFLHDIRGRGQYDAVLAAFPELVAGYRPNDDGTAAADPVNGRTASGQFLRETDNLILFGKLNHRASDRHALTLRYNFTDYSRVSDFVGEESRRFVESHSTVGSVVSVVGESGVNELRLQYAYDDSTGARTCPAARSRLIFGSTTRPSVHSASPGGCPSPTTSGSSRSTTGSPSLRETTSFGQASP